MSNFDDLVSALAAPADDQRSVSAVGRAVADSADGEVLVSFAARDDEDAEEYLTDADGDTIPEYDADGYPVPQTVGGVPVYIVDDDDNPLPVIDPATGEQAVRYDEDGNAALVWQTANVPAVQQGAVPTVGRVASGDGVFMASDSGSITAVGAAGWGDTLQGIAEEAQETAEATNQHFWADDNGIHVTEAEHDATTEHNILINSIGILLRKATNYLVSITQSAIAFYDGLGNSASNVVAQFGASGAQIGKSSAAHSVIDANGQRFYGGSDGTTQLANIGYGEGAAQSGTAVAPYYTFGTRRSGSTVGNYSFASGMNVTASAHSSHAEGYAVQSGSIVASGMGAHAEGEAQSNYTITASGAGSHAEGAAIYGDTLASGTGAHAEGSWVTSSALASHAEGHHATAGAMAAHAEGAWTEANANYSHAQNYQTIAASESQTAIGKYNVEDSNDTYALIVGNGTSSNRSNALTVDWLGNINNLQGRRTFTNALIVFGYVTGSGKTVQLYAPLPGFAETVTVTGTGSFTLRGGTGATLSTSVAASSITTKLTTGFRNLFEMRFTLSTAFAGGNDVSVSGFVSGLTLTF